MTDNIDPTNEAAEEQTEGQTAADSVGDEQISVSKISIMTPMGPVPVSALPRELLDSLLESLPELEEHGVPEDVRVQFENEVREAIAHAELNPEGVSSLEDLFPAEHDGTSPRQRIWDLLDEAFPNDPHLWNAAEALFMASEIGPVADEHARFHTLEAAHAHLDRRMEQFAAPSNPIDELLAQFRDQMDYKEGGEPA